MNALSLLACFSAFAPAALATVPTITGITGSPVQGGALTIAGAAMHQEQLQNLAVFFTSHPNAWSFEGGSNGAYISADGYVCPGASCSGSGVYDNSVKILGNQSVKFRSTEISPTCVTGVGQSYNYLSHPGTDVWMRTYVRWNRATDNGACRMRCVDRRDAGP
jgi:hypothetical protein